MSFLRKSLTDTAIGVSLADGPEALDVFLQPSCAATVWRRQMPQDVSAWFEDLDPEQLPSGRVVLPAGAVAETVTHLCDMSNLPRGEARDWFEADVAQQAHVFANLMQAEYLRLRLDVVTTNSCRKFHVDAITARLVCTYRGTGTQYGISTAGADPERVFTVQTGASILMRGTLWPAEPASGLLHRSPPIEGTGETRLLLVLDPIFDAEDCE